jgi:O-antigen/teichoic acid export membrane protein
MTSSQGRRILINAGALAGSNLWRIAISFLLQLLVARRLGLVSLGDYTVAMAFLNVGQVISEVGLPVLLVRELAQHPSLRRAYVRQALAVQMIAAVLVGAGLALLAWLLPFTPELRTALWMVAASLPFFAITSVGETLFQAAERMELVLGVEGVINLLIVILSVIVLWQQGTVAHLLAVVVLTQAISAGLVIWLTAHRRLLAGPQSPAPASAASLARQALPFFGLTLGDVLLQRLDILLLGILSGPLVVGVYSAGYNLVRVAVKLIQSFWRALYPTLSRYYVEAHDRYVRLAAVGLHYGLLATVGAAAVGTVIADGLLRLVYGADYPGSAAVLQVLVWTMPLFVLESAAVTRLLVERQPRASLWLTLLHLVALALLLPLMAAQGGALGAAWATLAAQAVAAVIALWLLRDSLFPWKRGGI